MKGNPDKGIFIIYIIFIREIPIREGNKRGNKTTNPKGKGGGHVGDHEYDMVIGHGNDVKENRERGNNRGNKTTNPGNGRKG